MIIQVKKPQSANFQSLLFFINGLKAMNTSYRPHVDSNYVNIAIYTYLDAYTLKTETLVYLLSVSVGTLAGCINSFKANVLYFAP